MAQRQILAMLLFATTVGGRGGNMTLTSPYFRDGDPIPGYFTCDGPNVAPPLQWQMPEGGKSVALVLEDITIGTGAAGAPIHWVAWDLTGEGLELEQQVQHEGRSSFESTSGYRGPCPADPDVQHKFRFTAVAANIASLTDAWKSREDLVVNGWSTWSDVQRALQGRIVGEANLEFTYRRGQQMVTLPPQLASDSQQASGVSSGGAASSTATPGGGVKGNPKLSKKFSPQLL